jgi:ABC-type sulfate/molybdate transport systems ATPase subunit
MDRFNAGAIHCCAGLVSYDSGQVTADGLTLRDAGRQGYQTQHRKCD